MNDVMMQLGDFQFSISTAAYQTLKQTNEWAWAEQKRFGNYPALQFTGASAPTIVLEGTVYPEHNGGTGQVQTLRDMGDAAEPLELVSGLGDLLGQWVIESLQEDKSTFAQAGVARKQEFTLNLKMLAI